MAGPTHEPHSRALRRGRLSLAGHVYVVTWITLGRIRLLADLGAGRCVVRALQFQGSERRAETLAYVIMPDHVHWMLQLRSSRSLSDVVHSVKRFTAREINALQGCSGRALWQSGFHDHAVRSDEQLVAAARYIVANPLRAGLVERVADYPFWDAVWLPDHPGESFEG